MGLNAPARTHQSAHQVHISMFVMRHFQRGEHPGYFTKLTPDGFRRARSLYVPGITRIVSSPFPRCVDSVRTFAETNDIPMHVASALAEYIDDERHGIPLETHEHMSRRVEDFILRDQRDQRGQTTLYVTHQSIAEVICGRALDQGEIVRVEHDWARGDSQNRHSLSCHSHTCP